MLFGEIHRDILTVSGIPRVLNILGSFAHDNSSFLSLKVTRDWNKFLVHFKCSCSLVAATAKGYDVPLLISAVSLLYMSTNQVAPVVTIGSTATKSLMAGMAVPIVEPRRVASWC